jgi:hypothetical protein
MADNSSTPALAVAAPWPSSKAAVGLPPALSLVRADAAFSRLLLLGVLDPADELVLFQVL